MPGIPDDGGCSAYLQFGVAKGRYRVPQQVQGHQHENAEVVDLYLPALPLVAGLGRKAQKVRIPAQEPAGLI